MIDFTSAPPPKEPQPTSGPQWVLVHLAGHGTFWVPELVLAGKKCGPVAHEHHVQEGALVFSSSTLLEGSYAYACNCRGQGSVFKNGQKIAELKDLVRFDKAGVQ